MTLLIARRELLDHLLSLKFHVSMALMAALLGLSGYVMYRDYRLRMENFAVLQARSQPRPGEDAIALVKPAPLSVFAKGLDELMTRGYTVTAYIGIEPHTRQTPPASLFALFSAPDLLYIIKALLSLVALLFAYDSISGEKEAGTLKLVLSAPISRGEVVAGKLLGGLAAVLLPFLAALAAVLLALATRPQLGLASSDLPRLALMAAAALLYAALFYSLGALVSIRSRSSAGALMVLLFLWAAVVFAVPSLGSVAARELRPLPSAETQQARRVQEFAKNRFLDIQSQGRNRAAMIAQFNRTYDRMQEEYQSKLDRMTALSKALSRISPAATLSYVLTDLAGTGVAEQRRLSRSLLDYKSRTIQEKTPPPFEFRRMGLADVLARGALADLGVLALMAAGMFAGCVFAFLRLDPR